MVAEAMALFPDLEGHWFPVRDGDLRVAALLRRHYSTRRDGVRGRSDNFAGPGEKVVLLTPQCDAIWVWRAERFRRDGQTGINCAVFRNEGPILSSVLIREACDIAWRRWPGERLYTFVWDAKVATSQQRGRNKAGWCYRKAGWRVCGRNADGRLTILELQPPDSGRHHEGRQSTTTEEVHASKHGHSRRTVGDRDVPAGSVTPALGAHGPAIDMKRAPSR